jgi:hypothetical protein
MYVSHFFNQYERMQSARGILISYLMLAGTIHGMALRIEHIHKL